MALRTPLYDWHAPTAARMVDFGGWDMPVQYTTITDEHTAVRTAAGLFDVSHMGRLSFAGADALALIQHVFTNDAATMKDGQVRYGLVCNERGGVRDDVLVYRWPYGWAMVVNACNRDKIVAWLAEHKGRPQRRGQRSTTQTTAMVAVQGPKAVELCRGLTDRDAAMLRYYYAAADALPGRAVRRQPHRLHRRGRRRDHASRRSMAVPLCGRAGAPRRQAVRPRRPRHAAARSGHAAVRPRADRGDRPAPGRPRLGGEARQGRLHRPRRPASPPRRTRRRPVRVGLELDGRRDRPRGGGGPAAAAGRSAA